MSQQPSNLLDPADPDLHQRQDVNYRARVVHLRTCEDADCQIIPGLHLVVMTEYLELIRGNAVAISYTWGQFFREYEAIGHDTDGSVVRMELGKEWELPDLIKTLSEICDSNEFCWIDQLCIKQDDDREVRATLAKIPDIYRNFDVVVLLPGSPCSCIDEFSTQSQPFPPAFQCPNNLAYGSWFTRLWTRQEFYYARNISVRWTSPGQLECIHVQARLLAFEPEYQVTPAKVAELVSGVSRFAMLKWREKLGDVTRDPDETFILHHIGVVRHLWQRILIESSRVASSAATSLHQWNEIHKHGYKPTGSGMDSKISLKAFLHGAVFVSDISDDELTDDTARFIRFLSLLANTSVHVRSATQPKDYVVAVWVDCPKYKLPESYKSMSLGALLDDALNQLRTNHGIGFATTLPAGVVNLIEVSKPSTIWRPALYLDSIRVESTLDVYGVLNSTAATYGNRDCLVPARFFRPTTPAVDLYDFETLFQDTPSGEVTEFLATVAENWDQRAIDNFVTFFLQTIPLGDEDLASFAVYLIFRNNVGEGLLTTLSGAPEHMRQASRIPESFSTDDGGRLAWTPSKAMNHVEIVYGIVAACLGLQVQNAKSLRLRVMVDLGDEHSPPRLGLSQAHFGLGDCGPTYTIRSRCCHDGGGGVLYEIAKREDATVRFLGVWISATFPDSVLVGEVCHHGYTNRIG